MAIKYRDLMDELENAPMTPAEQKILEETEFFIDNKIKESFDGGTVSIDLDIAEFKGKKIPEPRRLLLVKALEQIYDKAGWKSRIEYGEDDGPNRPGFDYWILSGKR